MYAVSWLKCITSYLSDQEAFKVMDQEAFASRWNYKHCHDLLKIETDIRDISRDTTYFYLLYNTFGIDPVLSLST